MVSIFPRSLPTLEPLIHWFNYSLKCILASGEAITLSTSIYLFTWKSACIVMLPNWVGNSGWRLYRWVLSPLCSQLIFSWPTTTPVDFKIWALMRELYHRPYFCGCIWSQSMIKCVLVSQIYSLYGIVRTNSSIVRPGNNQPRVWPSDLSVPLVSPILWLEISWTLERDGRKERLYPAASDVLGTRKSPFMSPAWWAFRRSPLSAVLGSHEGQLEVEAGVPDRYKVSRGTFRGSILVSIHDTR